MVLRFMCPSDVATQRKRSGNQVMDAGGAKFAVAHLRGWDAGIRLRAWNRRMALYGHEISDKIDVWEAGLDRYCKMEKRRFRGARGTGACESGGIAAHAGGD